MKSKTTRTMVVALAMASFCLMGCEPPEKFEIEPGPDAIDAGGNVYPSVKIGNQIWMAKNMNVKMRGASVCYDNNPANCDEFGRLYTWKIAKKVCPSGWHLPSKEEFETFLSNVGTTEKERSKNLRARSWNWGIDKFGFSALQAGYYDNDAKRFFDNTGFWSSSEKDGESSYILGIDGEVSYVGGSSKVSAHSVRCIKGDSDVMTDSRDGKTYEIKKIGNQVWMAENLKYAAYDGNKEEGEPECNDKYGCLYGRNNAIKACPKGWHLPSKKEFQTLVKYVGGMKQAARALKSENGWVKNNGENTYGFGALPAGSYQWEEGNGDYRGEGYSAEFWTSSKDPEETYQGKADIFFAIGEDAVEFKGLYYYGAKSVRCLRNSN